MKFNAFALTVVAAVAGVHAQSSTSGSAAAPTSTTGLSPCILQCTSQAATAAGCNGVTDITCVCTNTTFKQQALTCLQQSCTSAEVQAAEALQSQECGATASSAASSGASSATGAASSSGTRSGAASSSGSASHASSGASSLSTATSAARTSAAATAAASQSGNAARTDMSVARGGLAGVALAVVGVVAGAAFIL